MICSLAASIRRRLLGGGPRAGGGGEQKEYELRGGFDSGNWLLVLNQLSHHKLSSSAMTVLLAVLRRTVWLPITYLPIFPCPFMVSVFPCWLQNVTPSKGSSCKSHSHKPSTGVSPFHHKPQDTPSWTAETLALQIMTTLRCRSSVPEKPTHASASLSEEWEPAIRAHAQMSPYRQGQPPAGNNQSHQNMYETQTVVQTETHTCMEKAKNSYVCKTISPQAPEDAKKRVWDTARCFIHMCEPAPVFTETAEFPPWLPVLTDPWLSPVNPISPWRNICVSISPPKTKKTKQILSTNSLDKINDHRKDRLH